eukprot:scaffold308133_cov18-Tisochrysis_lutea.AAC.1
MCGLWLVAVMGQGQSLELHLLRHIWAGSAPNHAFVCLLVAGPVGTRKYISAFQGYVNQEQALKVHEFGEFECTLINTLVALHMPSCGASYAVRALCDSAAVRGHSSK